MSIRVMAQVWAASKMKGSSLLLQLAIADHADDGGRAYPAVESLANKIRMGERQTRTLLRLLEARGELATGINEGPHGTNVYWVKPGGVKIAPLGAVQRMRGGIPASPRGAVVSAPEPSVTIKNRQDATATQGTRGLNGEPRPPSGLRGADLDAFLVGLRDRARH